MLVTYRFRLYPTRPQERLMAETLETCRRLYNSLLADRRENRTGFYQEQHSLIARKSESGYLRAVHSQVLQDVNIRLDRSFEAFFVGLAGRPRFKQKERYNSFRYPQVGGFRVIEGRLRLSKIGSLKMRIHRPIEGMPKTCTIVRDIDQWYACISGATEPRTSAERMNDGKPVGVDLNVSNLATLSDDRVFENPRHLGNSIIRLKTLQRRLSRKKKGTNNREKSRVALAKIWRKVRRQRTDTNQKVSRCLANNYSTIIFEDLKIPNMVKNHNLASAIMDASWGQLRQLTAYKAERRGRRVLLVEPRGTSQKCSGCGEVVPKELSQRVHRCPRCELTLDRDVNAARNILKLGLEQARVEKQPLLVQKRRISRFAPMKQESDGFSRW